MSDDPLEAAAALYRTDRPCISDAMKSFCSVMAAAELVPPEAPTEAHELAHLLAAAKVVLRHINAHELPDLAAWTESHPQGAEESGAARIEAITQYRACHLLSVQCRQGGAKATKMFGRRYLQTSDCTKEVVRAAAAEMVGLPAHTVEAFLNGWVQAAAGENAELSSLVWAADFQQELERRKRARLAEISERRGRMEQGEDEAQRLREAMAAEGEADEPRVVELP